MDLEAELFECYPRTEKAGGSRELRVSSPQTRILRMDPSMDFHISYSGFNLLSDNSPYAKITNFFLQSYLSNLKIFL